MTGRILAAAMTFVASIILGAGSAVAGCAADLTRIQIAMPSAAPDIRAAVAGLVSTAETRAKANDAAGCAAATTQALQLLGLPDLAPITLSTPVPGVARQPHPPHPSVSGSRAADASKPVSPADGARTAPSSSATGSDQPPRADWYVVSSNVIGRDVTAQDRPDDSIGSIRALVIDSTTRQTTLALIETGGILGFGGKLIAVPFAAVQFFGRWDRPMVRASLATLQSAPRVTTAGIPELVSNAAWRAELAKHFNVEIAAPTTPSVAAAPAATVARPARTIDGAAAGDPAQGRSYAQGICAACHTFDQGGGPRVGPNLYGIVDRKIADDRGYGYSAALQDYGGSWTAANLDGFLKNPQAFAPGTTMPFSGISSVSERRNVIAYLETLGHVAGGPK